MKAEVSNGPSHLRTDALEFLQLVRITKKCVGMGGTFLKRENTLNTLFIIFVICKVAPILGAGVIHPSII